MAYIVAKALSYTEAVFAGTFVPEIPADTQVTGDYLLCIVQNDGGATQLSITGWTEWNGPAPSNSGNRCGVWYLKNTGSPLTAPTITVASDDVCCLMLLIRDADGTTFIDAGARTNQTAATTTPILPDLTTTTDGCLVLRIIGMDGGAMSTPDSGFGKTMLLDRRNENSAMEFNVSYELKPTAGAVGAIQLTRTTSDGGTLVTLAIKNKTNGGLQSVAVGPVEIISNYTSSTALTFTDISTIRTTLAGVATVAATTITPDVATAYALDSTWWGFYQTVDVVCPATAGQYGFYHALPSTMDFTAKQYTSTISWTNATAINAAGLIHYFEDALGNWAAIRPLKKVQVPTLTFVTFTLSSPMDIVDGSVTPIDWTQITHIGWAIQQNATAGTRVLRFRTGCLLNPIVAIGGNAELPCDFITLANCLNSESAYKHSFIQGSSQVLATAPIQIGDGITKTYFKCSAQSFEYPKAGTLQYYDCEADKQEIKIKASASDTIDLSSSIISSSTRNKFTIDSASSTAATYNFQGLSLNGLNVTWKTGVTCNGANFSNCSIIDAKEATFNACNITKSTSTTSAMTTNAGASILGCAFTKSLEDYAITMTTSGSYSLVDTTFTGYTKPLNITATTGTVTITLATGQTEPTYDTAGATVVFDQPVAECGLSFSGLVAGSQVVIYTHGTTTEKFRTNSSGATESYSEEIASLNLDYTIQKAGYVPIRVSDLTLLSVQSVPVAQEIDRAYVASSDLVYGSTATIDISGSSLCLNVPSTVQNYYSFLIESWIAQSALRNITFPVKPNGPNSFSFADWKFTPSCISYLSRDGMRYVTFGVVTEIYSAILSLGETTGMTAEYQQVEGATPVDAKATGVVDELIQVYGDATHGNFDYTNYLAIKYQLNGYREAYTDVVATYGTLADEFYIVSLAPQEIPSFNLNVSGAPGLTVTNHGATPVSWDAGDGAKDYSITIEDTLGNLSGTTIKEYINYTLSQDGTLDSLDVFNWPEMIVGTETVRGTIISSLGATLKGVRVIRSGGVAHPDFSRFQADDGNYGTPLTYATASISNIVSGSRLQVYNVTTSTEIANESISGSTWNLSYLNGNEFTAGDEVRVRLTYQVGEIAYHPLQVSAVASSVGWSVLGSQELDTIYNSFSLDGSLVTEFSADYPSIEIDISDGDGATSVQRLYAWFHYVETSADGIRYWFEALDAVDGVNFLIDVTKLDLKLDNISATPVQIIGGRLYRSDGTTVIADNSGSVQLDPSRVYVVATGSGVTEQDKIDIAALTKTRLEESGSKLTKTEVRSRLIPACIG